jgi:hypothetical protein
MRIVIGEHDVLLGAGEVAQFDTRVPHWFGSDGAQPVEVLSVGRSPSWAESANRGAGPARRSCRRGLYLLRPVLRVLVVGDVVEAGHDLARVVRFLHRDVRHESVRGRAVPVLLAGLDVADVARADLLYAAPGGDETDAVGDVQRLSLGVVVPSSASARGEADVRAAAAPETCG